MAKLTLRVNGTSREVESDDPDVPRTMPFRAERVKAVLEGGT